VERKKKKVEVTTTFEGTLEEFLEMLREKYADVLAAKKKKKGKS